MDAALPFSQGKSCPGARRTQAGTRVLPEAALRWLQEIVTLHLTPSGPSDTDIT